MERILKFTVAIICTILLLSNCASTKNSSKKCDGRKGQKTPMGLM
ncbi:MAG: hypothetical protein ACK476_01175 [Fluviicola sp.]